MRQLSLSHGDTGLTVTVGVATPLTLRRAFVRLRRATGEVLWSVDLDGREAEFVIPRAALLDAFDELWPGHAADAALAQVDDDTVPPLLADLGFTIESDRELGTVRAGTHDYVTLGPASTVMDASRPLPAANGNLTVYLRKGGGISLAFGTSAPVPRTRGSILWVRRGRTSWEFSGEVESDELRADRGLARARPPAVRRAHRAAHHRRAGPTRPRRWSAGAGCASPPSCTSPSCSVGSNDPSSSTRTSPPRSGPTPTPSTCGCDASPRAGG